MFKVQNSVSSIGGLWIFSGIAQYLLLRNGTINSLVCNFCGKLVRRQNHWILHCKTLLDALDYFQPLISELELAEVDRKELAFGLQEKCNRQMLRNLITFSIRFSIHKNQGTALKNPNSAKVKVINMAKLKIRKQIWDQFHLAMDKCQSDEFSSFFLIDNTFDKVAGKTSVLNKLLE